MEALLLLRRGPSDRRSEHPLKQRHFLDVVLAHQVKQELGGALEIASGDKCSAALSSLQDPLGDEVIHRLPDAVVIAAPGVSCAATGTASCGSAGANTIGTQAVSYTGAQIAAGAGHSIQLTVPVAYPSTMTVTPLSNMATATHVVSGNTANGSDSSARAPAITLAVTKDDGSATYVPGGTATYTVTVTNSGATHAGSVAVSDPLPTGVTLTGTVTCTPSPGSDCGTVSGTAGQASFGATGAAIAGGGGTLSFQVPVAFALSMTDPSITNTATATATDLQLPPPGTVSAQGSDTNARTPVDLGIAKTHSGNFYQGQSGAQFSVVVTNNGLAPSFGAVTVSDVLPAGLTATAIAGTGWSCSLSPLQCARSDVLLPAQSYPAITLTVDVATNAGSPLVNQATVAGGGDPSEATANDPVVVNAGRDLAIVKSHSGSFFQGQAGAQFTISVQNVGGTASSGTVTVTESVPAGLTATSITGGGGWSCTQPAGPCTNSDALAPGASFPTLTLTVNVAASAGTPIANVATVSGGGDINPLNNVSTDSVTVLAGPDPTIVKSHSGSFHRGQVGAQFTIGVQNVGGAGTVGTITVTDTLPAGLTATAISGTGWSCTLATLTCTRSDALAPPSSYPSITLTVDVATNAPSSVTNVANVSGGGDVNPSNNTASDPVTVVDGTDLAIAKTHAGNFYQTQVGATFTITVTNAGGAASSGTVTVGDTLPAGLTATAIAGTGWTCTLAPLQCTRSTTVAAGASFEPITLTVDVAADAGSPLVNTATVSGGGDLNPDNNTANDSVIVDIRRIDIVATPVCINDTPYVNYTVTPVGFTPGGNPVTWQWIDSTGAVRETDADLPLTGQLLWPGAVVVGGVAVGWPGWQFVGGQWVQVDDGLRPTMRLVATVNPTAETVVSYPPATPQCSANPRLAPVVPAASAVPAGSPAGLATLAVLLGLLGLVGARRAKR